MPTTVSTHNQRFRRGRGVFTCAVYDGSPLAEVAPERDRLLARAVSRGSDESLIRREFPELWGAAR